MQPGSCLSSYAGESDLHETVQAGELFDKLTVLMHTLESLICESKLDNSSETIPLISTYCDVKTM